MSRFNRVTLALWGVIVAGALLPQGVRGQEPLPAGNESRVQSDINLESYEYHLHEIDDYQEHTRDPQAVREDAIDFIRHYLARYYDVPHQVMRAELIDMGEALLRAGSEDPLVTSKLAQLYQISDNAQRSGELYERAWNTMRRRPYSAHSKVVVCKHQFYVLYETHGLIRSRRSIQPWANQLLKALEEAGNDEAAQNALIREVYWFLALASNHDKHFGRKRAFVENCEASTEVAPWIQKLARGRFELYLVDHLYHGGYIGEDPQVLWGDIEDRAQNARTAFREVYELKPDQPMAATGLILLARYGFEVEDPRVWFDRAVAAQFDYPLAYESYIYIHEARRDQDAILAFGHECAATERYDTLVPYYYITAVTTIGAIIGDQHEIWEREGIYETADLVLHSMAADPWRSQGETNWYNSIDLMSQHAAFAIIAKELEDARALFITLGDNVDQASFEKILSHLDQRIPLIFAITGPASIPIDALRTMIQAQDDNPLQTPEQLARFEAIANEARQIDDHPATGEFIDYLTDTYHMYHGYAAGEWVEIPFTHLWHWEQIHGKWKVIDDQTIEGVCVGGMFLELNQTFAGPMMMECDVEVLDDFERHFKVGFMLGQFYFQRYNHIEFYHAEGDCPVNMRSFYFDRRRHQVGVLTPPMRYHEFPPTRFDRSAHLRVKAAEGYYELYGDGQSQVEVMDRGFQFQSKLALGNCFWFGTHGTARFSNVRIRQWSQGVPPHPQDLDARIEYYEQTVTEEPENGRAWQHLGYAQCASEEYAEAIVSLTNSLEHRPQGEGVHNALAQCCMDVGDYTRAMEYFTHAENALSEQPQTLVYRAAILSSSPNAIDRDGQAALDIILPLCEQTNFSNRTTIDLLAIAYAEMGQFEEAIRWVQRAIEISPPEERQSIEESLTSFREGRPYRMPTAEEIEADAQQQ